MLIHQSSLSETVDAVNDAVFFGKAMAAKDRRRVARWIAARQGLPGAYGELFAGFAPELASGIRLFTGERVTSASARHILGEESCRALLLLKSDEAIATAALTRATAWIVERVEKATTQSPRNTPGAYCCGKCTVGLWRNILAGGLDRNASRELRTVLVAHHQHGALCGRKDLSKRRRIRPRSSQQPDLVGPACTRAPVRGIDQ